MSTPVGPYTPIVRVGDWLIVSGQVGIKDGKLVDGGTGGQLEQALANLDALLRSEGAGPNDVVKTTVFLRHMSDYALMNEIYTGYFSENRPARSAVAVGELPIGALVEIEAWAYTGAH